MIRITRSMRKAMAEHLHDNRLSDKEFAAMVGITPSTMCRILRGPANSIREENLKKILDVIKVQIADEEESDEEISKVAEVLRDFGLPSQEYLARINTTKKVSRVP